MERSELPDPLLQGLTFEEESQKPDQYWADRLGTDSPGDLPLIAEAGSEIVGLTRARIDPSIPTTAGLFQVCVAPDHRSLGLGR
jgi:hypothetical protein